MPYYLVSSTNEANVKADDEDAAILEFCELIDQDHSDADVTELDPEDKKDAITIKHIDKMYLDMGLDDDDENEEES